MSSVFPEPGGPDDAQQRGPLPRRVGSFESGAADSGPVESVGVGVGAQAPCSSAPPSAATGPTSSTSHSSPDSTAARSSGQTA